MENQNQIQKERITQQTPKQTQDKEILAQRIDLTITLILAIIFVIVVWRIGFLCDMDPLIFIGCWIFTVPIVGAIIDIIKRLENGGPY